MEEYNLGELATLYDSLHKTPKAYTEDGFPMIRVTDVKRGFVSLSETKKVPEEVFLEFSKKHKPTTGDIIFTRVGSYGNSCYVDKDSDFCLGQNTVCITSNAEKLVPYYLFCFLNSISAKAQIDSFISGSSQPTISLKSIKEIKVPVPTKNQQEAISKAILNYDNLIENNNRRIAILEDMAKSLYREWFVNFRYPNYEDNLDADGNSKLIDSPVGQIPEGWEFDKLENMSSMKYGKMSKKDLRCKEGIPIYSGYKITGYYPEANLNESKVIVIARGVGGTGDVKMSPDICWLTNLSIYIMENEDLLKKSYLFYQLKFANLRSLDSGTSISQITIADLSKYQIIAPPIELQVRFEELCKSFWSQVKVLTKKNENLRKQRDMLLPKLISGQIELKD